MADSTNTTGVSQQTLDQVLRSGYANINSSIFNTAKSNINPLPLQQITLPPIQITEQNAPNTSIQNRQLTNQFLDVNNRNFNLQSQQIQNQYDLQTQSLQQSQKDAQSRNLMAFGQSSFVDPGDSSRNLSMVTNVNAKVNQEVRNIQNQASIQLNQVATNYAQDRQFNFNEALQRGIETRQQYTYNPKTGKIEYTKELDYIPNSLLVSPEKEFSDDNIVFCSNEIIKLNQERNKISLNPLLIVSILFFDFLKIRNKLSKLELEIKLYEDIVEQYQWYYSNGYKF